MSAIHQQATAYRSGAIALVVLLAVVLRVGPPAGFGIAPLHWALCYFVSVNLVTVVFYWRDKTLAGRSGKIRVPESVLVGLSVFGGLPGALFAMRQWRHKTSKIAFRRKLILWHLLFVLCAVGVFAFLQYR